MVAIELAAELEEATGVAVLISGNSCYGACDVDVKLASIVDLLFHFGHTGTFLHKNVVFIELRSTIDIQPVVERALRELRGDTIGLVATVQHAHAVPEAQAVLIRAGKQVLLGKSATLRYAGQVTGCDFSAARVPCDELLFIGSGRFHPEGIALYTGKRVVAADPCTFQIQLVEPGDLRKKRYAVIARAMDAKSFGIIVGLKSGQLNLSEASAVQRKAAESGFDAYLLAMDEITEAGLMGFRVDAFVNTACPRLIENFVQFNKPVLSVNEFEVVIGEREWDEVWR